MFWPFLCEVLTLQTMCVFTKMAEPSKLFSQYFRHEQASPQNIVTMFYWLIQWTTAYRLCDDSTKLSRCLLQQTHPWVSLDPEAQLAHGRRIMPDPHERHFCDNLFFTFNCSCTWENSPNQCAFPEKVTLQLLYGKEKIYCMRKFVRRAQFATQNLVGSRFLKPLYTRLRWRLPRVLPLSLHWVLKEHSPPSRVLTKVGELLCGFPKSSTAITITW